MNRHFPFLAVLAVVALSGFFINYFCSPARKTVENEPSVPKIAMPIDRTRKEAVNSDNAVLFLQKIGANKQNATEIINDRDLEIDAGTQMTDAKKRLENIENELFWKNAFGILDEILATQPKNKDWQNRVSAEATELLKKKENQGTFLDHCECGATICKMVLTHQDAKSMNSFYQQERGGFTQMGSWDGDQQGHPILGEDGHLGSEFIFSRKSDVSAFDEMRQIVKERAEEQLKKELATEP